MITNTVAQNPAHDTDESDPWPAAPEETRTPRQIWCQDVQTIAGRAKATLPECAGRVDAAVKLVLAGDVELLPDGHARVQSQANGQTIYRLVGDRCDCRDYDHAPSHWCKHRIAAGIMKRAGLSPVVEMQTEAPADEALRVGPTISPTHHDAAAEAVQGIDARFITWIAGRPFVRHAGLLKRAHECGLQSLTVHWTHNSDDLSLAHATAIFADGRRFEENGDASPSNTNKKVAPHFRRCACTRASARALRLALGVDLVAVEELSESE
jgi:hypothetical protein